MDLGVHEGDIPMAISGSFGESNIHVPSHDRSIHDHSNVIHTHPLNDHIVPLNGSNPPVLEERSTHRKVVRYKECLKNHAASIGGNATDGCGEFMPSGEEGTIDALKCSACNCHRNFHRKQIEGEVKRIVGPKGVLISNQEGFVGHSRGAFVGKQSPPNHMIMSYNMGMWTVSDEQKEGGISFARPSFSKKRFRTKFTQEQKDKMLDFAEKIDWKLQKQEESAVLQFCQEIGVNRRVLKVWMHNNKHNLGKKSIDEQ